MRRAMLSLIGCVAATLLVVGCNDTSMAPSDVLELTLSPATVSAGATSEGFVTLRGRTRNVVHVSLSSSDRVASVPASIDVPPGAASAAFVVRTRLVAADTVARITAAAGDARQEIPLQVLAPIARPLALDTLALDAMSVRGGQILQGTLRLTSPAPSGGVSVSLGSSNAAAVVPATMLIPSGAISATFSVSTRPVTLDTQLEITATHIDQTRTVPLRVTP
jgi:hypothetical protein